MTKLPKHRYHKKSYLEDETDPTSTILGESIIGKKLV
jgi:hypothetical protein